MYRIYFSLGMLLFLKLGFTQDVISEQKKIDTIKFIEVDFKKAENIRNILQSNSSLKGWSKYYAFKSYVFFKNKENDSALFYADKAINNYQKMEIAKSNLKSSVAKAHYIKGYIMFLDKKYILALQNYYKALEYEDEALIQDSWKAFILQQIIFINLKLGDYELALEKVGLLSQIENIMKYKENGGRVYLVEGILHFYLNDWESSLNSYKKALHQFYDTSKFSNENYSPISHTTNIIATHNNIGDIYYKKQIVDSAVYHYKQGISLYNSLIDEKENILSNNSLTPYFVELNNALIIHLEGDSKKALNVLKTISSIVFNELTFERDERDLLEKLFTFLEKIYLENNLLFEALNAQKQYANYLYNYSEQNISKQVIMMSTEFEVLEKEKAISDLVHLSDQQNLTIKHRNFLNWVLFIGMISIIVIGILVYKKRKLKIEYRAVNLEQRLLRSQLNPHFIFNSLSSINNLILSNSPKILNYVSNFSDVLRLTLKNSREEFVYIEEELKLIKNYIDLESGFSKSLNYSCEIDSNIKLDETLIPPMFIQPIIENAITHGFCNKDYGVLCLHISKNIKSKSLRIKVEDDGVGYNKSKQIFSVEKYKSVSTDILKERLHIYCKQYKIKKHYEISQREKNYGTIVQFDIPYIIE